MKKVAIFSTKPALRPILFLLAGFILIQVLGLFPQLAQIEIGGISLLLAIHSIIVIAILAVFVMKSDRKYDKRTSYACFLISPVICSFIVDSLNGVSVFKLGIIIGIVNYILYLLVHLLLYALTSRLHITILLANTLGFVLGIVNHFVVAFRGNPLLPWDIASAGTALSVLPGYKVEVTLDLIFTTIIFVLFILLAMRVKYINKGFNRNLINIITGRVTILLLTGAFSYFIIFSSIPIHLGIEGDVWSQNTAYKRNGVFMGFLMNLKYVIIEKPQDYSTEKANEIVSQIPEATLTDAQPQNVIIIMNESFSDLSVVGDFETNIDYIPFITSLKNDKNAIIGNNFVSVFGARTSNTEFEALTGNTMAFLPVGSIAYQQYIKSPLTSIASLYRAQNYTTTAMHPFDGGGWDRDKVYPLLGMEEFYDIDDWENKEMTRSFVNDMSDYDEIIQKYEEKPEGQKSFYFNVTMQNHGGYTYDDYPTTVKLEGMQGNYPKVEQYLSLIKESDEALQHLVEYFREQDEKTMILFFGDHQPTVEDEFYEELYGKKLEDLSLEELQKRYETPYIIWSNYDLPDVDYGNVSTNYLSAIFLQTAGFEVPAYQRFLLKLYESIPVINANGYLGDDGNWYTFDQKSDYTDLIEQYEILQYNNMFDRKNRLTSVFDTAE